MRRGATGVAVGIGAAIAVILGAEAQASGKSAQRPYALTEERELCDAFDPLRQPFFGDTHIHTAYSFDASVQDTRNTPRDAYRFARGEALGIQPYGDDGSALRNVRLERPLDFAAVTDHAELLGDVRLCTTPGSASYGHFICKLHRNYPKIAFQVIAARSMVLKSHWGLCGKDDMLCTDASGQVWRETQAAAEASYDRSASCRFTSFVAYEWTATVDDGKNLHRNVIFRNERVPALPTSWIDTPSASHLWDTLQRTCIDGIPGCDVFTIPHNSNLSADLMFETAKLDEADDEGSAVDATEARRRARWEPLIEIMQHKGDSECRLGVGAADEECGFEKLSYDRFGAKFSIFAVNRPAGPKNFVRFALERGLQQQSNLGVNGLKYGIIASTDTHIATPGLTREKNHVGHGGAGIGAGEGVPVGFPDDIEFNPGGLAVVWAEENTRDALFSAMRRREVYGTSGTRPILRYFGGWDFPEDLCQGGDFVARGYAEGVPMGGDLPARPVRGPDSGGSAAPRLALWAMQDPGTATTPGTPLQRIQVVKGWLEGGQMRESVTDVVGGPNDASVDIATCELRGRGATSLCTVWTDPDFDPTVPAFYYGRILENPSCRWTQYVCNAAGVDCRDPSSMPEGLSGCCSDEHQAVIQERAWTSPIWYTPE